MPGSWSPWGRFPPTMATYTSSHPWTHEPALPARSHSIFPPFESGLALQCAWTNWVWQKWYCASSKLCPQKTGSFCFLSPRIQLPCCEEAPAEWDEPTDRKSIPGKGREPGISVNCQYPEPKCGSEVVWISQPQLTTQHSEWPLTNSRQSRREHGKRQLIAVQAITFWCGLLCSNGSQNSHHY